MDRATNLEISQTEEEGFGTKNVFIRNKGRISLCCPDENCQFFQGFLDWEGMETGMVSLNFANCDKTDLNPRPLGY